MPRTSVGCAGIGASVGVVVGLVGGNLAKPATSIEGLAFGILLGLIAGVWIGFLGALAGEYRLGGTTLAAGLIGILTGAAAGSLAAIITSKLLAMLAGLAIGAVIGFALCELCQLQKIMQQPTDDQ